ncbi:PAS domain S-box-containing protein [Motilibacter peucedani]|uniref:histidine kinase n=1 Tax=Motilibacter peucedani TaxID=598650 RepID=A0A420XSP4_9ACTN|nr:ATP-binding protein [Motilibacter peucedani]RKS77827.1 PAS domain S-box-containing protein [Motilibacter peucedani]
MTAEAAAPLRTLADDLPDGLVVADERGTVVAFNPAAERLVGLRALDVLGGPLEQALPLADREGRLWWSCARPFDGLATRTGHPERTLLLPDGREVLVVSRYVRERPLGAVVRVVVTLRDARARAREELSRAELVSTVAHELRSPLTSVKGFTATLLKRWDRFTDEQKRLMLETVEADADRVTRLITELLDTARIDSGRLQLQRVPVDLGAAVQRHVAGMLAGEHDDDRFTVEVDDELPELWADRDKLDQVIGNLLENAVRHGDGHVTVTVRALPGDRVRLSVGDEGEGVAAEMRQRVFTKFWRSGRRGGTGLGLYIVRGLVEAHGGRIEISDAPGGGALFAVELPSGAPDFEL